MSDNKIFFAVPLHVKESVYKLSLIFDQTIYQVIKAPFTLQGPIHEDVVATCNLAESSFPKIPWGETPPDWFKTFEPSHIDLATLIPAVNAWMLDPANQLERKIANPKMLELVSPDGPKPMGPKYLEGSQEELSKIMRGICAWFVAETKYHENNDHAQHNELKTNNQKITVTGPTDQEGPMNVEVSFPDTVPNTQAITLAKIAFLSNRYYGYTWTPKTKNEKRELYLQANWEQQPIPLEFTVNPIQSEADQAHAFILAWAKNNGIDLPNHR